MALAAPFSAAASRVSSAFRSAGLQIAAYCVIGLIGLMGLGFLVAALFIWLASVTDPLAASLLMGFGFVGLSIIILATVMWRGRRKKRKRQKATANTALIASTMSLATTGLRIASRSRSPIFWPAIAAVAAGWYMSRSGDSDEE